MDGDRRRYVLFVAAFLLLAALRDWGPRMLGLEGAREVAAVRAATAAALSAVVWSLLRGRTGAWFAAALAVFAAAEGAVAFGAPRPPAERAAVAAVCLLALGGALELVRLWRRAAATTSGPTV